jgi:hypothetical protein
MYSKRVGMLSVVCGSLYINMNTDEQLRYLLSVGLQYAHLVDEMMARSSPSRGGTHPHHADPSQVLFAQFQTHSG